MQLKRMQLTSSAETKHCGIYSKGVYRLHISSEDNYANYPIPFDLSFYVVCFEPENVCNRV